MSAPRAFTDTTIDDLLSLFEKVEAVNPTEVVFLNDYPNYHRINSLRELYQGIADRLQRNEVLGGGAFCDVISRLYIFTWNKRDLNHVLTAIWDILEKHNQLSSKVVDGFLKAGLNCKNVPIGLELIKRIYQVALTNVWLSPTQHFNFLLALANENHLQVIPFLLQISHDAVFRSHTSKEFYSKVFAILYHLVSQVDDVVVTREVINEESAKKMLGLMYEAVSSDQYVNPMLANMGFILNRGKRKTDLQAPLDSIFKMINDKKIELDTLNFGAYLSIVSHDKIPRFYAAKSIFEQIEIEGKNNVNALNHFLLLIRNSLLTEKEKINFATEVFEKYKSLKPKMVDSISYAILIDVLALARNRLTAKKYYDELKALDTASLCVIEKSDQIQIDLHLKGTWRSYFELRLIFANYIRESNCIKPIVLIYGKGLHSKSNFTKKSPMREMCEELIYQFKEHIRFQADDQRFDINGKVKLWFRRNMKYQLGPLMDVWDMKELNSKEPNIEVTNAWVEPARLVSFFPKLKSNPTTSPSTPVSAPTSEYTQTTIAEKEEKPKSKLNPNAAPFIPGRLALSLLRPASMPEVKYGVNTQSPKPGD